MSRLVLFNKPFDVLCQFTDAQGRTTLAQWIDMTGVYAAGRLDRDSEGLLVLTDDGALTARIADPKHKLPKTYRVQVEGVPDENALETLRTGVRLNDGMTLPAQVRVMQPPAIWQRDPPIRFRKNDVTTWLEITLREGRNRQVRRMTAAVGFPTLRLVRWRVGEWTVEGLAPGEYRVIEVASPRANEPAKRAIKAPTKVASTSGRSASVGRARDPSASAPPTGSRRRRPSHASRKGRGS